MKKERSRSSSKDMNSNLFSNKRLNDYDLNILNDNSFKDLDDKTLKLECLIAEKEEALENLNNKIKGAELLGKLLDVMDLKIQAKQIENELADLKEQYSKRNMAEKITDVITSSKKSKPKLSPIHRLAHFVSRKIIAKMSKKVQSILDLSDSLDTLTSINENVDELIAMKVPYGETKANYEKLTNYLYRANRIHSQINKKMQSL